MTAPISPTPLAAILVCTVLVACSSSSDDTTAAVTDASGGTDVGAEPPNDSSGGNASGGFSLYGFVSLDYAADFNETQASASFARLDRASSASAFIDELPELGTDRCVRLEGTGLPELGTVPESTDFGDLPVTPVGAGEFLTLNSASGTYASLPRNEQFGLVLYGSEDSEVIPGAIPSSLTLDIPGEQGGFPAFDGVSMPDADPLEIRLDEGSSSLAWNGATSSGDSAIEVLISRLLASDELLETETIECTLIDDGDHALGGDLFSELPGEILSVAATRYSRRVVQEGTAILVLEASAQGIADVVR